MWFLAPPSACTRLPALRRALVDDPRHRRRADERDRVDPRVVEDPLDDLAAAVDEVHDAGRQAEPVEHLEGDLLGERHLLGRLEDERVAAGDRERQEPERHHRREVERHDRRADADRLADRLAVDVARDVLEDRGPASSSGSRRRASTISIIRATSARASTIVLPISVVTERARSSLARVEPLAQREQPPRALDHADRAPLRQRGARGAHGGVEIGARRQRHARQHLAGGGVGDVERLRRASRASRRRRRSCRACGPASSSWTQDRTCGPATGADPQSLVTTMWRYPSPRAALCVAHVPGA